MIGDALVTAFIRGGWVMYPLALLSVLSVAATIERTIFWMRTHRRGRMRRVAALARRMRSRDRTAAQALVEDDSSVYADLGRQLIDAGAFDASGLTEGEARELIEQVRPPVERASVLHTTIITAAPMLGILGTVTGIIQSFNLLGEQSALTDPREVSAGIAEALITTAFGLIIALFTLFPYMIFRAQVDRSMGRLESLIAAAQEGEKRGQAADDRSGEADGATIAAKSPPVPRAREQMAGGVSAKGSA
jgi:biopolymer transport protein ExbB